MQITHKALGEQGPQVGVGVVGVEEAGANTSRETIKLLCRDPEVEYVLGKKKKEEKTDRNSLRGSSGGWCCTSTGYHPI